MKKYEKLKKNSKKVLKYHLFYSVIVCFLTSTILNFSYKINNLEIVNRFLTIIHLDNVIAPIMRFKPTVGVFASFFNQLSGTGSIALTLLTLGFQVLLERLCEWETLMPKATSLLQNSHFAIELHLLHNFQIKSKHKTTNV